ncbi:uncharacterized protein L969DRAFT_51467 [Mixia osmundae IAM 14324]|uniref:endopeptidase La n=1 Tax=Mixia osmundae (strain CBS 9802 / IAM 14324 / JCM 22182 / KY 12970) TaxID=764103 RepID=G7E0E7_MIXOS|nr:uncharacterized protein L969DRAFT_51467 [Mixia osmundae IAM 14324]KEI38316.1 hypothetical protein L969DRAFT_51467 [Mixia osmundae IAM 14324]GAA96307.1 hypothetical protein E5Q_02973 [Mixia osmundae IAM 14324]
MASRSKVTIALPSRLGVLVLPPGQILFPSLLLSIQLNRKDSINLVQSVLKSVEESKKAGNLSPDGAGMALVGVAPLNAAAADRARSLASTTKDDEKRKASELQVIRLPADDRTGNGQSTKRPTVQDIFDWGCLARIVRLERTSIGYIVVVEGLARIRLDRFTQVGSPYFEAFVSSFIEEPLDSSQDSIKLLDELKELAESLLSTFTSLRLALPPGIAKRIKSMVSSVDVDTAGLLADVLISTLSPLQSDKLDILSLVPTRDRLVKATTLLSRVNEETKATKSIGERVEGNLSRRQREFFLRSQMEAIAQELKDLDRAERNTTPRAPTTPTGNRGGFIVDGGEGEEDEEMKELENRLEKAGLPTDAHKLAQREFKRLKKIPQQSVEHGVIRNYLDWLADMPWSTSTPLTLDRDFLQTARKQLDEDHFGLDKVKRRLIEYLAVLRLRQEVSEANDQASSKKQQDLLLKDAGDKRVLADVLTGQDSMALSTTEMTEQNEDTPMEVESVKPKAVVRAPILLLVGPPGVGKTSIARSLATAMGRQFHRVSLGGCSHESDIRGHRRTYVAAMPGLICTALRKLGVNNPIMLLDEIDKLGAGGFNGNPEAALLEVLDPEQNSAFQDHYIGTPFDLSKVLFVATANSLETISAPLRDRMEIIEIPGYVYDEKIAIAKKYLLPEQMEHNALATGQIQISDDVLATVITSYTREAGVRTLEREIGAICRAKAVQYAEIRDSADPSAYDANVLEADLETILGLPKFDPEITDFDARPGVATGLAYQGSGNGGILHIESTAMPGKGGSIKLTGSLGDVISESAQLALSWIKTHAWELGLVSERGDEVLDKTNIHLHLPSGSIKKDGPSAGIGMVVSLVSLLKDVAVDPKLAMTGEITLRGLVTPVGGIREKVLGAHRAGITKILLPTRNRKDVEADVPQRVKDDIEFVYIATIQEGLMAAFEGELWTHDGHAKRNRFIEGPRL